VQMPCHCALFMAADHIPQKSNSQKVSGALPAYTENSQGAAAGLSYPPGIPMVAHRHSKVDVAVALYSWWLFDSYTIPL
jgi:hypothetical protein